MKLLCCTHLLYTDQGGPRKPCKSHAHITATKLAPLDGAQGELKEPQATLWRPSLSGPTWARAAFSLFFFFFLLWQAENIRSSVCASVLLFLHLVKVVWFLWRDVHSAKTTCLFPRGWASLNVWELQECPPYWAAHLHWQLFSDVMSGGCMVAKNTGGGEFQEHCTGFGRGWDKTGCRMNWEGCEWLVMGRMTLGRDRLDNNWWSCQ